MLLLAVGAPAQARAFSPSDPLAAGQWYLGQIHAFDAWPLPPTNLLPVRVGVIDSGIDGGHPEFAGRIVAARSFVGGNPLVDEQGHGTFVAGEIAAALDNGQGIAGIAPSALLVVAKVVGADGSVSPAAEAAGIRWAVDQGARVLNLSLGGVRDPAKPSIDTYSAVEAAAVRYALAHRAVVVAAVGNGDEAPSAPWPYASYPAALPHVIGVSALTQTGNVPDYSNRDAIFNDIAAPGDDLLSTFPRDLTAQRSACADQGYSDCGSYEYRYAAGTSFAAPEVAAAAADLLAIEPGLLPDQVSWLLERTADDVTPATGCPGCSIGRDPLSGWGRLDIARAVEAVLDNQVPPADPYDPNDDAGADAYPLWGQARRLSGTVDYWDDPVDVYSVYLRRAQRLRSSLASSARVTLRIWRPGTPTIDLSRPFEARFLARGARGAGRKQQLVFRAETAGWYYLEVRVAERSFGTYALSISKR